MTVISMVFDGVHLLTYPMHMLCANYVQVAVSMLSKIFVVLPLQHTFPANNTAPEALVNV